MTQPQPAKPIAVVGAGTMGNGIAQVSAVAGSPVTLTDISQAQLDRAMKSITVLRFEAI